MQQFHQNGMKQSFTEMCQETDRSLEEHEQMFGDWMGWADFRS